MEFLFHVPLTCWLQDLIEVLIELVPILLVSGRPLHPTVFWLSALRRGWCCLEVLGSVVWLQAWPLLRLTRFCNRHSRDWGTGYCPCALQHSPTLKAGHLCLMDLQTCQVFANLATDTYCVRYRLSVCLGPKWSKIKIPFYLLHILTS